MKLLEPHVDTIRMQDILHPELPGTKPLNLRVFQQRLSDVSIDVLMNNACASKGLISNILDPYDCSTINPIVMVDEGEDE